MENLAPELKTIAKENHKFRNWANTFGCSPELYFEPSTEDEVSEVIFGRIRTEHPGFALSIGLALKFGFTLNNPGRHVMLIPFSSSSYRSCDSQSKTKNISKSLALATLLLILPSPMIT
jgi:hypothetical protein